MSACSSKTQSLEGTQWRLDAYRNAQGELVEALPDPAATAEFQAAAEQQADKVSGLAGCNQFTASYHADGNKLTIDPPASTRKFCSEPAGVMEQENGYLQALGKAASFRISGTTLELFDSGGDTLLTFTQAGS